MPSTEAEDIKTALRAQPELLHADPDLLTALGLRIDAANVVDFGPAALAKVKQAGERDAAPACPAGLASLATGDAQMAAIVQAIEQLRARGFDARDVRHIVVTHLDLDHAVLRWLFQSIHRRVRLDCRLPILRWLVLYPRLGALERTFPERKSVHHPVPSLVPLRAFEIIGEQQFLLHRNWLGGDFRQFRAIRREAGPGKHDTAEGPREDSHGGDWVAGRCFYTGPG